MILIRRYRIISSLITFTLVLLMSIITLFAYFEYQSQHGIIISSGEYDIELLVSFNDVVIDIDSPYYDLEKNIIIVNAYDELSENYIENLKIDISITSEVAARVRIKLKDEWELTRVYLDQNPEYPIDPVIENIYHTVKNSTYYPFSLFKVNPTFNAIYDLEGYTYINQIIPKNQTTLINFIDGGDGYPTRSNEVFDETCYVHVDMIVDIVQANRFVEKWGIDPEFFS